MGHEVSVGLAFFNRLVVILAVLFSWLAMQVPAQEALRIADRFQSTGDEIEGWFWLRDPGLLASAEYTFSEIPTDGDIVLVIDALATDRVSGGPGSDAVFDLLFGFPGSGTMGGVFYRLPVEIPNVSSPDDPLGYHVRGTVVLPRESVYRLLSPDGPLFVRLVRANATDPHVAFNPASVRILLSQTEVTLPPASGTLPETVGPEDQFLLGSGSWTGTLTAGEDPDDWYTVALEAGQVIRAQLDLSDDLRAILLLKSPDGRTRADLGVQPGGSGQLVRAADVAGLWQIQLLQRSGTGDYRLHLDVGDQDDAGQGNDAAPTPETAIALDDGIFRGSLLRFDDIDWYRVSLDQGEILGLSLAAPQGAQMSLMLSGPDGGQRRITSASANEEASITYAADEAGEWLIRVRRSSGEGTYTLGVERTSQTDGGLTGDAGPIVETATPIDPGISTGLMMAADDLDFYRFDADQGDIVEVTVVPVSEGLAVSAGLADAEGVVVRGPETARGPRPATIRYAVPGDGPWFLRVRRVEGGGAYEVALSITPQQDGGYPGDAANEVHLAGPIEPGPQTGELLPADDRDIFRLPVERGDILEARVGNLTEALGLSASIFGPQGVMAVGPETVGSGEETTLRYAAPSGGDLFVRLRRWSGAGIYGINTAVFHQDDGGSGGDGGPCGPEAVPLAFPVTNGWMLRGDAEDCFTVALSEGDTIDLSLSTDGRLSTRALMLRRPGGSGIAGQGSAAQEGNRVTYTARETGLHHVLVRRDGGDGPYRIDVAGIPVQPTEPGGTLPSEGLTLDGLQTGDVTTETDTITPPEGGLPPIVVTVSDGGRRLTSNEPFALAGGAGDPDLDGLRQDWEDQVAARVKPWLELDEEEDWLVQRPEHRTFTFTRIYPYTASLGDRYILMHFSTAWTRDYGRLATGLHDFDTQIAHAHNGDISTAILAWRIVDDRTLDLEAVYTSAHHSDTLQSGVWTARGESCNTMRVYGAPLDRWLCASLEFHDDRLVLQISEDKHAVYPTAALCEDVILAQIAFVPIGEDCVGGGLHLFDHANAGEPTAPIAFDMSGLFPGEYIWNPPPDDTSFCGGRGDTWDRALGCAGALENHLSVESAMLRGWLDGSRPEPPLAQEVIDTINSGADAVIDVVEAVGSGADTVIDVIDETISPETLEELVEGWPF